VVTRHDLRQKLNNPNEKGSTYLTPDDSWADRYYNRTTPFDVVRAFPQVSGRCRRAVKVPRQSRLTAKCLGPLGSTSGTAGPANSAKEPSILRGGGQTAGPKSVDHKIPLALSRLAGPMGLAHC
jgi:hypothetical protein